MRFCGLGSLLLLVGCSTVAPVQTGQLYRAQRISSEDLEETISQRRIQTVVNVRGFEPEATWYREQRGLCERLGVEQIDITLASNAPNREEVIRLLETFRNAKPPILITGDNVSGRVGFASALYRLVILGEPKETALKEIPFWQSRRLAFAGVGAYDQFLYDWRSEEEFYAKYQLQATPTVPTTESLLGQGPGLPSSQPQRARVRTEVDPVSMTRSARALSPSSGPPVRLGAPVGIQSTP